MLCPLVLKGDDNLVKEEFNRYPAIFIHEKSRKIRAYAALESNERFKDGIFAESIGRVPFKRWTQITLTISPTKLQIYLNGVLDGMQTLEGRILKTNTNPLFIGGHPNYSHACLLEYYFDNLKIYSKVLPAHAVQASAGFVFGDISSNRMMIGCLNCKLEDAKHSCIENYHLCTNIEMITWGGHFVRIMGWNTKNAEILVDEFGEPSTSLGVSFCCRDYLK